MKYLVILLQLFTLFLCIQCKSANPLGYYHLIDEYPTSPCFCFYYNDRVHAAPWLYRNEERESWFTEYSLGVFQGGEGKIRPFYNSDFSFDTIQLTLWGYSPETPYHIIFTPSRCEFYLFQPCQIPAGGYEFTPSDVEQKLVSFAVSQLDFDDTVNTTLCRRVKEYCDSSGTLLETTSCYLRIKSADLNVDYYHTLYVDRTPDALIFLIDALESFIHDYSKPAYRTSEVPSEAVLDAFIQKGIEKHPILPIPEE
jgi:hypothetical protein